MDKEALKLALEALEEAWYHVGTFQPTEKAIDLYDEARAAIKEALAQPEPPPECQTEAEKTAFAFGWFKAMEAQRKQEPVAIHQFRSPHCSDWYDGVPDHHDGHGPYEVRTLYTTQPQPEQKRPPNCGTGYCSCIECVMEPEQEPVAYAEQSILDWLSSDARGPTAYAKTTLAKQQDGKALTPIYTTPPQRKPLTVDEVWQNDQLMSLNAQLGCGMDLLMEVVEAIEAAHGIKEEA